MESVWNLSCRCDIKNTIRALTKVFEHIRYGNRLEPARDWFVLLTALLVALVVSIVWNVLFFLDTVNGVDSTQVENAINATSTDPIQTVEELFLKRQVEEARYKNEYRFVDPSR